MNHWSHGRTSEEAGNCIFYGCQLLCPCHFFLDNLRCPGKEVAWNSEELQIWSRNQASYNSTRDNYRPALLATKITCFKIIWKRKSTSSIAKNLGDCGLPKHLWFAYEKLNWLPEVLLIRMRTRGPTGEEYVKTCQNTHGLGGGSQIRIFYLVVSSIFVECISPPKKIQCMSFFQFDDYANGFSSLTLPTRSWWCRFDDSYPSF